MRISNSDNNINFRAIHIANATPRIGANTDFKLYRITERDRDFLDCLYQNINLQELMPKLHKDGYTVWDSVLNSAVNGATRQNRTAFLIAADNRPCGISVSSIGYYNKYKLNQICTFPVEPGKRVALAGKTLFRSIFDDFLASGCKEIELEALKLSPFGVVSKYLKLGFGMYGGSDYVELMRLKRQKVPQSLENLDKLIIYSPISDINPKDVNLFSEFV